MEKIRYLSRSRKGVSKRRTRYIARRRCVTHRFPTLSQKMEATSYKNLLQSQSPPTKNTNKKNSYKTSFPNFPIKSKAGTKFQQKCYPTPTPTLSSLPSIYTNIVSNHIYSYTTFKDSDF